MPTLNQEQITGLNAAATGLTTISTYQKVGKAISNTTIIKS